MFGCRWTASLLCAPIACLQLSACSADVEIFKTFAVRAASGVAGAPATSTDAKAPADNANVLLKPTVGPPLGNGACQPGHYVGTFNGTYNSAAWGNGSQTLSIAATTSNGHPGLEFWLEPVATSCGTEEFCADFTVKGGKIRGFANPFSDNNGPSSGMSDDSALVAVPFEIDFGGDLDCSRGLFKGLLQNGCYEFLTVLFRFEGDAPAFYDADSSSFTNGHWTVKELPSKDALFPPDANIGGMGNWLASWANDNVDPAADSGGLCAM